jgi:hypothetical protein
VINEETYQVLDVHFAVEVPHHRNFQLAASPEAEIVGLENLVKPFCTERPELVNRSEVAELLR